SKNGSSRSARELKTSSCASPCRIPDRVFRPLMCAKFLNLSSPPKVNAVRASVCSSQNKSSKNTTARSKSKPATAEHAVPLASLFRLRGGKSPLRDERLLPLIFFTSI